MRTLLTTLIAALTLLLGSDSQAQTPEVAEIKPEIRTGFAQAGWKYDRYSDMPSLDAHTTSCPGGFSAGAGMVRVDSA